MSVEVIGKLPSDRFFKFRPDQLNIMRKICNMEDPEKIRRAIEILRDWVQREQYFNKKDYYDTFFEKLLIISKGSMERSKIRMEKICTLRTIWPSHFDIGDVNSFADDFKVYNSVLLRDVTEAGSRVSLSKVFDTKPLTTGLLTRFIKYAATLCEYAMAHDYANGFVAILDYRDINLVDLLAFCTRHVTLHQQAITLLTDGYGMRLQGIHVLTRSKATDALVTFGKKLLSKKLASRFKVHSQMDTLYDFVPRKILPFELGGYGPSMNDMHELFIKELFSEEHRKWVEEANRATIDESLKPKDYFSDDYISISGYSLILPDATEEVCRVNVYRFNADVTLTPDLLIRFTKYVVSMCEHAIAHDYPNGFVVILDHRFINFLEILAFATRHFTLLQHCITILLEGYGMRVKGIHLVTPSKAAETLVTFLKQLLTAKVGSRINVHKDTNTLFAHVPKNILPADLGGDAPPLIELQESFLKALSTDEHKEWMKEAQCATINQSKKPKDYFDNEYIGMPGSFRTLSVD